MFSPNKNGNELMYKILNGNELLIEGGLEAGINLYTGYPGSPLADFFNILYEQKAELSKRGIKVVIANSEANAAAMASGAKMANQNVLVGMKSMGLHVASDALSVGNFANPGKGGVVIAVGDDPWSISTSTPADSRFLFKHLHIPFLEPSTPQELKDWIQKALELSQNSSVYCGLLLTTHLAEGGGRVEVYQHKEVSNSPIELNPDNFDLSRNVMVPPNSLFADKEMIEKRFPRVLNKLSEMKLDQRYGNLNSRVGVISSGAVFETLKIVLEEHKYLENLNLYKLATSYPLIEQNLKVYLSELDVLIVVEEKRGFLEAEINNLITKLNLKIKVVGKKIGDEDLFVAYGGLSYELLAKAFNKLKDNFQFELSTCELYHENHMALDLSLPKRLPTFCPGCPHRETLSLLKDLRRSLKEKNVNLISHGDVGCYSLSFLEPFKEMHDLSAMGQGGAMGAGTDIFVTNPSVVLMGDSTFFHSGMTAISNSVQMGHNITYILLDNDNTAMTGHQVTPRSGISVDGETRPRQNMIDISRSMKVNEVIEVNPSDRYFYKSLLADYIQKPGTKVIVSTKECALTFGARQKKTDREFFSDGKTQEMKSFYQINTLACEDCRECVEMTGCPGLSQTFDAYGTKVMIDPQICVSDSYCTKIKACPSFELVNVYDYHPTKYLNLKNNKNEKTLPLPTIKKSFDDIAKGYDLRVVVIGVGGSGVTTISRVLAEAALEMGNRQDLDFKFVDQKGLAQRNGSVSSFLSLFKKGKSQSPVVPLGSADLVLSPDLLEGSRALQYLSPTGLSILDSDYQIPLSILLDRGLDHDPVSESDLRQKIADKKNYEIIQRNFKENSFNKFSKSVYSSVMILGAAFQAGRLPFSESDLKKAIERSVPKNEIDNNLHAFQFGRELYLEQKTVEQKTDFQLAIYSESMKESLNFWQNKSRFEAKFKLEFERFHKLLPSIDKNHIAQYLHDIFVYDYGMRIEDFYSDLTEISKKYQGESLARAVRTIARTYWVKDEVFVSHLLASPLKTSRDQEFYSKLGNNYQVIHINRPHFDIFGKSIEFDLNPKDWLLKWMRHLRVLRTLMPAWHTKEKKISSQVRSEILKGISELRLRELESIKGYREVRYQVAEKVLGKI